MPKDALNGREQQRIDTRLPWERPTLRRLAADKAQEPGANFGDDGGGAGGSGSPNHSHN